jgi:hypothetical protein
VKIARCLILLVALCSVGHVARADPKPDAKPVPAGVLKAYKGPEGEVIAMVEVSDGKQVLVYFKHLGGDLEGKSLLYLYEDLGKGDKTVYLNKQRGSKTYRSVMLSARDNQWSFYHPTKPGTELALKYSEKDSESLKIDDVVKAYKP